jgi:hypothetical protein
MKLLVLMLVAFYADAKIEWKFNDTFYGCNCLQLTGNLSIGSQGNTKCTVRLGQRSGFDPFDLLSHVLDLLQKAFIFRIQF